MEQGLVSVSKAGIVASLPARTTIIAAANPIRGHYNNSKSFALNVKLTPALISRFDLIFVMIDSRCEKYDLETANFVLNMQSGEARPHKFLGISYICKHTYSIYANIPI